ncbi:MAG: NifU family protein [Deltaproteobacteria bacterium]|nr:NifU family protein [Deltaproteobacteria bacterium]
MFSSKKQIEQLETQIASLQKKIKNIQESYEQNLRSLRQQVAAMVSGYPVSPEAILSGLGYSEIPKENVLEFIEQHPELLVLDVRSDTGWNAGHIPNAKHIPAEQVLLRLHEFPSKKQPILTICTNGNTGVSVAQQLAREGFQLVFNALGGMAGYSGKLEAPKAEITNEEEIEGENRELIAKVVEIIDRDIRPGLKKDGGDLKILSVHEGVVNIKMIGACAGCGALHSTVNEGIKKHVMKLISEIKDVRDLSKGI